MISYSFPQENLAKQVATPVSDFDVPGGSRLAHFSAKRPHPSASPRLRRWCWMVLWMWLGTVDTWGEPIKGVKMAGCERRFRFPIHGVSPNTPIAGVVFFRLKMWKSNGSHGGIYPHGLETARCAVYVLIVGIDLSHMRNLSKTQLLDLEWHHGDCFVMV